MMNWEKLLDPGRKAGEQTRGFDPQRSPFETDFDRIIFSHPFRRLQDKTQVHPLPEQDFVHTRLSHSLEVSSVGRSLGKRVASTIIERHPELAARFSLHDFGGIVAAASLAHDIGNPPFGHSGENAISDYFRDRKDAPWARDLDAKQYQDISHFEGNAQGFRLLGHGQFQDLRLTRATLGAFSKYPRESLLSRREPARRSQKKYGFFQAEKETFSSLAAAIGLLDLSGESNDLSWSRHPLAFLVEAADDICYGIIDLEDGCRLGLVSYNETEELLIPIVGDLFDRQKLEQCRSMEEKVGILRALSIAQLITQCSELFIDSEQEILEGSFDSALTDGIDASPALEEISRISLEKIYRSRKVLETEAVGYEVLPGLLKMITDASWYRAFEREKYSGRHKAIIRLLPAEFQQDLLDKSLDPYKMLLLCTDFVSNMTDTGAISFYRLLKGIDLPRG